MNKKYHKKEPLLFWKTWYKNINVTAITKHFFDNLPILYSACDLVICRSGAGSLFETVYFKKPCITIPLETKSNTHQIQNALSMQKQYPELVTVLRQNQIKNDPQALSKSVKSNLTTKSYQKNIWLLQ